MFSVCFASACRWRRDEVGCVTAIEGERTRDGETERDRCVWADNRKNSATHELAINGKREV